MERYYYNHMNKIQQKVYQAMKAGLLTMDSAFLVPRLEVRELICRQQKSGKILCERNLYQKQPGLCQRCTAPG